MLTREQVVAMTQEQLLAAKADAADRHKLNMDCQQFAAGVSMKRTHGGSKVRATRVAKTDWSRIRKLEAEGRDIRFERNLIDEEIKRRSHAEEARA
ncbi:hypothetical protein [Pseudomonas sp. AU12215]|uniref:hypothetical protein n=1 Tax=Pseudomonas sp. AU12215 TaxID=1860123 RepID=UPI0007EE3167|nr:hypothetical protein [Pseudomonas sp. AU12215]OBY57736.1 hypothetical protein A9513_005785 [Pseudomonas sp. AU12215]